MKRLKIYKFKKENILKLGNFPGIYVFLNAKKKPIYVGKSVDLKSRLRSYLLQNLLTKTKKLVSETSFFSFIKTNSEIEALLLEANLVKRLQPKYNIQLKDDKHPLYIKISKEKYPQVLPVRKANRKESLSFFGPFPSSNNVRNVLRQIRHVFPFAQHKPGRKTCFYNQIGLCNPCPSEIENIKDKKLKNKLRKKYKNNISAIIKILSGRISLVKKALHKEMLILSKKEKFEEANFLLKQINDLEYITQPITPYKIYLKDPNLVSDIRENELDQLKKILLKYISVKSLDKIECFDVAHLAGTHPTASMVTFIAGEEEKSLYRHFKIRQEKSQDDIASLKEVIRRRLAHADTQNLSWRLPNLIIVDGGKAQTSIAWSGLRNYSVPVVGLAKNPDTLIVPCKFRNKIIFKEIVLEKGPALNLLQRIRDEAHRFARKYHHILIKKKLLE
mgnify:FL=1